LKWLNGKQKKEVTLFLMRQEFSWLGPVWDNFFPTRFRRKPAFLASGYEENRLLKKQTVWQQDSSEKISRSHHIAPTF
jgi:hypothetical protein